MPPDEAQGVGNAQGARPGQGLPEGQGGGLKGQLRHPDAPAGGGNGVLPGGAALLLDGGPALHLLQHRTPGEHRGAPHGQGQEQRRR